MIPIYFMPLKEEDLPFFLEVRNECREFLHDPRSFTIKEATDWFRGLADQYFLIRVMGQRAGYFRTRALTYPTGYILEIGADLHKDYRGHGVGYDCWKEFLKSPLVSAADSLRLEVLGHNIRAYNLYIKLGFKPASAHNIRRFDRDYPSIVMTRQSTLS